MRFEFGQHLYEYPYLTIIVHWDLQIEFERELVRFASRALSDGSVIASTILLAMVLEQLLQGMC